MGEKITASKVRKDMRIMVDGTAAQVTANPMAEVERTQRSRGQRVYYIATTAGEIKLSSNAQVELAEEAPAEIELAEWEAEGGSLAPEFVEPEHLVEIDEAHRLPEERPAPRLTGSAVVEALEKTWDKICANHRELPPVVIVTGSGMIGPPRWGHFRALGWAKRAEKEAALDINIGEMFVAGETLARGAEHTLETMLHEAAHTLAKVREVQDTSRQNRWHNGKFRALAKELGLEYIKAEADPKIGFSEVLMTEETKARYALVIKELDEAIHLTVDLPEFLKGTAGVAGTGGGEHIPHGGRRPKAEGSTNTNNLKLTCCCVDDEGEAKPRIIRASRKEAERGQVMCGVCREYFEVRD